MTGLHPHWPRRPPRDPSLPGPGSQALSQGVAATSPAPAVPSRGGRVCELAHGARIHPFTHSFAHSLTGSLAHSFTRSLSRSLTHSLVHPLARLFMHSSTCSLVHLFTHSFIHPLTHPFRHAFIHSLVHSLTRSSARWFIHARICSHTHSLTCASAPRVLTRPQWEAEGSTQALQ